MSRMIALYTETLEELLDNQNYGEEEQSSSLTEILDLMSKFPKFVFGEDLEFEMKDLFMHKYDIREIGAETEELFMHYWRDKTNELLMKYAPKLQMWIDNFKDLFKFTVRLELTDSTSNSDTNQNTYYLNPVNNRTENLKVSDVDKSEFSGNRIRTISRDALQTVWGKTRADIMAKIFELRDIFNDCLSEYETIFMGVI